MSEQRIVVETKRIWWCKEHEKPGHRNACPGRVKVEACPMVERQLAPLSALIIERAELPDMEKLREAVDMLYEPNPDDWGRNTTPVRWPLDVIGESARWVLSLESEW